MGEELVPKAEKEKVSGQHVTAFVAYLTACLVLIVSLTIFNGMDFDFYTIALETLVAALMAMIPFIVIKLVMNRFAWKNAVSHAVGGAVAGMSIWVAGTSINFSFELWRRLDPAVILAFGVWGGFAGLIYWGARSIGRRLFKGATE